MQKPGGIVRPEDAASDLDATSPAGGESLRNLRFSLASGSTPLDGYTIKRGIGIGGFGEVYYAISDGGKDVALKRIQRNLDIELRGVRQCLNLKHPNLLSLYDIKNDESGQTWVVMEFVSGESLQQVIERNPNGMPQEAVDYWFEGISAGVSHLHDCGIVHRDLKPGNIFMDEGMVKIGDYGLSKFISCSRRSGQTQSVGTFHYMAPEIGQGRYGKEIDVYALGIILYEMLTGHVPFDGESSQEIIMKHLTAQPRLDRVPAPYRNVIARALAKDPEQRISSAPELRAMLRRERGPGAATVPPLEAVAPAAKSMLAGVSSLKSQVRPDPLRLPNEPIARAVYAAWRELAQGWRDANLGVVPRILLVLGGVFLMLVNAAWIVPYLGIVAIAYGVYLAVRGLLIPKRNPSSLKSTEPPPAPDRPVRLSKPVVQQTAPRKVRCQRQSAVRLRAALLNKPLRQRITELTGSMLMAALVAAVVGLLLALLVSAKLQGDFYTWGPNYVWLTLTSTLAAWGVLAASKSWEGTSGDAALRRFTMLVVGLGVGLGSYALTQFLEFQPSLVITDPDFALVESSDLPPALHHLADGSPTVACYLAYFGGLFLVFRWWKQADPIRRARLSILATAVCVFGAIFLEALLQSRQGFLVAAITALAVQLSSPWMSPEERRLALESGKQTEVVA
jgi:hypothetical protein